MFDYPAIYKEADNISNKTQKNYFRVLFVFLGMLVISSILSTYYINLYIVKLTNAIISLIIVVISFVFHFYKFQGKWYNARAVAESIKTISWRYAVKAEPYDGNDEDSRKLFLKTVNHIINMNHDFQKCIEAEYSDQQPMPESMINTRQLPLNERINIYHRYRVLEQRDWYKKKSKFNNKMSKIFFIILIVISIILSILLFSSLKESNSNFYFPSTILLSLISIIFTWVQTKKYYELDKSYALASHEINFIATQKEEFITDSNFSEYVINAENAFSREHTQWIARKDT
jgi:ABC-type multidrug transport system fused ATPase/permease subunit